MIAKSFKQIALATIGTSCVAFGVATEAQAFGTLNMNSNGLLGTEDSIQFTNSEMGYSGTGDFAFLSGNGSVDTSQLELPGGPVNSWFEFDDNSLFAFDLSEITLSFAQNGFIGYDLIGTITNNMGTTFEVDGKLTTQMVSQSGLTGSSWSATLETRKVPEPSTMLGLGLVGAASAFGLKKKNS